METNYIQIMIESLEKKSAVLNLVEQLTLLDRGFEKLYEKVRAELQENRAEYRSEIERMQNLIREISAQTNTIQTQEERSKKQVEQKFADVRRQVKGKNYFLL